MSISRIEENTNENEAFSNGSNEKFNSKELIAALNKKSSGIKKAFQSDLGSHQNRKTFPSNTRKNMNLVVNGKTHGTVPNKIQQKQQKSLINDRDKIVKYVINYFVG